MVRVLLALIFALISSTRVYAIDVPNFPSCASPSGHVIASYDSGVHGIVGSDKTYVGSDRVYQVGDYGYTQCFCSVSGEGIQTDWWKDGSLSEDQVKILKSLGWFYIPDGSLWGLTQDPYMARNTTYSCLPSASTSPSTGERGGGNSTEKSESGQVLGLAATGNTTTLLAIFGLSLVSLYIGLKKLLS